MVWDCRSDGVSGKISLDFCFSDLFLDVLWQFRDVRGVLDACHTVVLMQSFHLVCRGCPTSGTTLGENLCLQCGFKSFML